MADDTNPARRRTRKSASEPHAADADADDLQPPTLPDESSADPPGGDAAEPDAADADAADADAADADAAAADAADADAAAADAADADAADADATAADAADADATDADATDADAADADAPVVDATAAGTSVADEPGGHEASASSEPVEPSETSAAAELEAAPTAASAVAELDDWTAEEVADTAEVPTTLWSSPATEPATWLPWLQARSPDERICPFLRAVADDDGLGFPVESPDAANRCAAMRDAVPQSLRQQELVCLTPTHVNCPRYLRGAAVASEAVAPTVRPKAILTPAISAALVILALSFGASVVFGLANGGLAMPSKAAATPPAASATALAVGSSPATPVATVAPTVVATTAPSSSVAPSATPSPAGPSPAPTATPVASSPPAPVPSGATAATPAPTSGRYKLLTACPDKPDCWVYRIRSGDNLYSIAKYFGVRLSTVKALNPWTRTTRLKSGQKLILPTPTR